VRHEKTRNGCKDDENIRRSPPEGSPCPGPELLQEVAEAEENSGMESRDKHGEYKRQRIHRAFDLSESVALRLSFTRITTRLPC
jgi:hypothetical protein